MKKPVIVLIGLLLALAVILCWPSADAGTAYAMKPVAADAERQRELEKAIETIGRCCREEKYELLAAKGFTLSPVAREAVRLESGRDPVAESLAVLKEHARQLDWSALRINTYDNAPSLFEVTLRNRENDRQVKFSFDRAKNGGYRLIGIEES